MTRNARDNARRFPFWLILVVTWIAVAAAVAAESIATRDYIAMLDESGTLPADVVPLRSTVPADYADAYTWTRLALGSTDLPWAARVRRTQIDNFPSGREVHWNSAYVRLIATAARVRAASLNEPLEAAAERMRVWFNLPVFMAFVVLFSTVVVKRFGVGAAVVLSFAMLGFVWFYDGFAPSYLDHHGVLTACTFGVVLGAFLMGAGWIGPAERPESLLPTSRDQARFGATLSAISGSVGLWMSAASVIPTIAIVGLSGVSIGLSLGRETVASGAQYDASLWRFWGRVGAIGSILAYALEYAPSHLGFRLEVNHPLYALAWLGGAELVAEIVEWRISAQPNARWRTAAAVVALIAPLVVVLAARSKVFVPFDPQMARVHAQIKEFFPISRLIHEAGVSMLPRFAFGFALLIPVVLVARKSASRFVVSFLSLVAVLAVVLACWQVRWWLMASGPELCLVLAALLVVAPPSHPRRHWLAVAALSALFTEQAVARIRLTRSNVQNQAVGYSDALQPMYRDAAVTIQQSSPDKKVALLAGPNASTAIGYFGRFETVASLYWENLAGLKAAAEIFSAPTDSEAFRLLTSRGVTHLAVTSLDNSLTDYLNLVRPGASPRDLTSTFGWRLLEGDSTPPWLRAIPFRPRLPSEDSLSAVLLFEIVPNQTELEASWQLALADIARGKRSRALQHFSEALVHSTTAQRSDLFEKAAVTAYQWREHALAITLLDSAMIAGPRLSVAANLAWILATSNDDQVRNGSEALRRAQELYRKAPKDQSVLDATAAALAETGHFDEAIVVCQRMDSLATVAGDTGAERRARERMASYAAHRPWRQ